MKGLGRSGRILHNIINYCRDYNPLRTLHSANRDTIKSQRDDAEKRNRMAGIVRHLAVITNNDAKDSNIWTKKTQIQQELNDSFFICLQGYN